MIYKTIVETNTACLQKNQQNKNDQPNQIKFTKKKQERDRSENNKNVEDSIDLTTMVAEKSKEGLRNILVKTTGKIYNSVSDFKIDFPNLID